MEEKVYKCKYCGKEFKNPAAIGGHTYACPKNPKHKQNIERSSNQFHQYNQKRQENKNYGICKYCGKELDRWGKQFCDNHCAAKFHNELRYRNGHTTKGKTKIFVCLQCGNEFEASIHLTLKNQICETCRTRIKPLNKKQKVFEKKTKSGYRKLYICKCIICENEFTSWKKTSTHCSSKCINNDPQVKEKLRKKQQDLIKQGKHKGWASRNIRAYPEKFWMNVLTNNKIEFEQEVYIKEYRYFLDFVIQTPVGCIDLEIDGGQHKYQKDHDSERDNHLKDLGYIVYRVEWNEINTEFGKSLMKHKIDEFINFYNSFQTGILQE